MTRTRYASSSRLLIQFIVGCLLFVGTHAGIMWICVGATRCAAQHHRCGTYHTTINLPVVKNCLVVVYY